MPDRFGLAALIAFLFAGVAWGDGLNDLPISEVVPVPEEMRLEVQGRFGLPGPDNEAVASLVEGLQVSPREHASISYHHQVFHPSALLEGLDGRDEGMGFALVALPTGGL